MIVLKTKSQEFGQVHVTAAGGVIAVGDRGLFFWPTLNESPKVLQTSGNLHVALLRSPDRILCSQEGSLTVWDTSGAIIAKHALRTSLLFAAPVGDRLIALDSWRGNVQGHQLRADQLSTDWAFNLPAIRIAFLPSGQAFIGVSFNVRNMEQGYLSWIDANTGTVTRQWLIDRFLDDPVVAPDGSVLVGSAGYRFLVCDLAVEENRRWVSSDGKKHFTGLAFHPSGRYLAAVSNDTTVKVYDTRTWELTTTITWNIGRLRCIAFSPDGTLAAAGSDASKIVVWDFET